MEPKKITSNEKQKTIAINKHHQAGNQPLMDEVSLPEKLKHLSKHPPTRPWQNLHTETQAPSESTDNNCWFHSYFSLLVSRIFTTGGNWHAYLYNLKKQVSEMKKHIPKDVILQTCIEKQQELIANFEDRVAEMKADTTGQTDSASQMDDRTADKIELLITIEKELAFATMEMGVLKALHADFKNTKVEPGAVVITDQRNFFISVSSEKMEIEGEVFYGISTQAPIYASMQDLKKGDKFEMNKTKYKIEDVY